MLLPDLLGRETGSESCTFPPSLLPSFIRCSPSQQPRRHAQQTSSTTRSGRHAAFIMFPRSSFDGTTPTEPRESESGRTMDRVRRRPLLWKTSLTCDPSIIRGDSDSVIRYQQQGGRNNLHFHKYRLKKGDDFVEKN